MPNIALSEREKRLAVITAVIIILTVFFSFILEPQIKKISKAKKELKKISFQLEKNLEICRQKKFIEEKHLLLRKEIIAQAPPEEELSELLSELQGFARTSKIIPISIEPLPIKKYDFFRELTIEMSSQGELAGLTAFLYKLKHSSHRFIVNKFLLSAPSERSKLLKMQISLSILLSGEKE